MKYCSHYNRPTISRIDVLRELADRPCPIKVRDLPLGGVLSQQDARGIAVPYLDKYPDSVIELLDADILSIEEERHYALQAIKHDAHIGIFFREQGVLSVEEIKPFALDYLLICPWVIDEFSGIVNQEELNLRIVKSKLTNLLTTYGLDAVEQGLEELKSQLTTD